MRKAESSLGGSGLCGDLQPRCCWEGLQFFSGPRTEYRVAHVSTLPPVPKWRFKSARCHLSTVYLGQVTEALWTSSKVVIIIPPSLWMVVRNEILRGQGLAPSLAQSRCSGRSQPYCPTAQGPRRWTSCPWWGAPAICPLWAAAHLLPLCSPSLPY